MLASVGFVAVTVMEFIEDTGFTVVSVSVKQQISALGARL
jgi:hypothetical protein